MVAGVWWRRSASFPVSRSRPFPDLLISRLGPLPIHSFFRLFRLLLLEKRKVSFLLFLSFSLLLVHYLFCSVSYLVFSMLIPLVRNRLWKVNMDPTLINQDTIHFKIRLNTCFFGLILDECVLQRVLSLPVPHYLALLYWSKPRENHLQIMLLSDWVQFANK